MPSVIRQDNIPEVIRLRGGMDRPDYIDLFTITTTGAAAGSPEQWSRSAIEGVAGLGGQIIWRGVLGLRLKPQPSKERVGGWEIGGDGEDWIRLEASSWFLTAHLVLRLHHGHLSVATLIRYDRPMARLIWVPLSAIHRRLMPGLLHKSVRLRTGLSNGARRRRKHEAAASAQGGH
jgi:hypothetical protein